MLLQVVTSHPPERRAWVFCFLSLPERERRPDGALRDNLILFKENGALRSFETLRNS
jgi:hypothetical protein